MLATAWRSISCSEEVVEEDELPEEPIEDTLEIEEIEAPPQRSTKAEKRRRKYISNRSATLCVPVAE